MTSQLEKHALALEAELGDAYEACGAYTAEVLELQAELEEARADVDQTEILNDRLRGKVRKLEHEAIIQGLELLEAERERDQFKKERGEYHTKMVQAQGREGGLERDVRILGDALDDQYEIAQYAAERVIELQKQLSMISGLYATIAQERDRLEAELTTAEAKRQTAERKAEILADIAKDRKAVIDELKSKLERHEARAVAF